MGGEGYYVGKLGPGEEKIVGLDVPQDGPDESVLEKILPSPADAAPNAAAQRIYNRKREVLQWALLDLGMNSPPAKLEAVALGWSGEASDRFRVTTGARQEGVTLWASRATVRAAQSGTRLSAGLIPFSIYAPASEPPLPTYREPYSTLDAPLTLAPYADITLRLPPGAKPQTVRFSYTLTALESEVSVLAYNPRTGAWTPIGELVKSDTGTNQVLEVPDPATYTGPAGELTLRLLSSIPEQTLPFSTLEFGLNEAPR
jgi:hypothetical protein